MEERRKLTAEEKADILARLEARYAGEHAARAADEDDQGRAFDAWAVEQDRAPARPSADDLLDAFRPDWMADALCAEPAYRHVAFFPEKGEDVRPAKAVCERCIVAQECKRYAEANGIKFGVWGGANAATLARRRSAA